MEMFWFSAKILGIFCLLIYFIIHYLYHRERKIVSNRYEWLKVIEQNVWLPIPDLIFAMLRIKRASHFLFITWMDIPLLEGENLVESRDGHLMVDGKRFKTTEYRLTELGSRKKQELKDLSTT